MTQHSGAFALMP